MDRRGLGSSSKNVVHRVDDVTEILSCYATLNGSLHPIPMALKRGLAAP